MHDLGAQFVQSLVAGRARTSRLEANGRILFTTGRPKRKFWLRLDRKKRLNSQPALRRRAKRFFAIWGGLAVVVLAFAGYVTYVVVRVNQDFGNYEMLGIFPQNDVVTGKVADSFRVSIDSESAGVARIVINMANPGKIVLNHVAGPEACMSAWGVKATKAPFRRDDTYLIDFNGHNDDVQCLLKSVIIVRTFTTRDIHILNMIGRPSSQRAPEPAYSSPWDFDDKPVPWTLDETEKRDASELSVTIRRHVKPQENRIIDDSIREVFPGEEAEVHWIATSQESLRDILLVIIGAAVALGAAMLLEALRPYVDRFVERSTQE